MPNLELLDIGNKKYIKEVIESPKRLWSSFQQLNGTNWKNFS